MAIVIINPSYGGNETGNVNGNLIEKNYNLEISKKLYNDLKNRGIETYLLRDSDQTLSIQERLNLVKQYEKDGKQVILVTIMLSSGNDTGAEIIYALREDDSLAYQITNSLESDNINVIKYYQLRDPYNTSKDYYEIIRDPINIESLIISLGYVDNINDLNFLLNNEDKISKSLANGIINYLNKENIYIVKSGDTLFGIAKKFNISVNDLKSVNNLTSNNLIVGQELIISKEKQEDNNLTEYLNYTVKKGDSLYKIAKDYNTTVNALKEVNNLTSNNLSINQVLKIPNASNNIDDNYSNYVVKSGDSLYKIANLYQTTVNDIKKLNNLTSNNLSINQVLKIPNNNTNDNYINYVVKSGDSLYKIANLYQTTVNDIKKLNNLTSNNLSINQVLKIPK